MSEPSPAPGPIRRPDRALRVLDGLRARLRRVFLVDGLVALGLGLAGAALGTFALDYALRLPQIVRGVLLAAVALGLAAIVVRRLVRPRRVELPAGDLAVLIEAVHPELRQSLVTAVDLSRPESATARYYSAEMIATVVAGADRAVAGISIGRVFDLRRLRRSAFALGALLVVILAGGIANTDLAGIWFRRIVLLTDVRWPKRVQLAMVSPTARTVTVALGEDLPVEVRAERGQPGAIEVLYWVLDGRGDRGDFAADVLRRSPDGSYRKSFTNISRPFVFEVRAADDALPPVTVEVEIRPKISRVHSWLEYPAYTGRPSTPAEEPLTLGHIQAPVGTAVRFEAFADTPVSAAYFQFIPAALAKRGAELPGSETAPGATPAPEWPPVGPGEVQALAVERAPASEDAAAADRGSVFRGTFRIVEDGAYQFRLLGDNGLQNLQPVRFRVQAIVDRAPSVRVVEPPKESEEASPEATVPIRLVVRDDYGLQQGVLKAVLSAEEQEEKVLEFPLDSIGSTSAATAAREGEAEVRIDIQSLGAVVGSRLQYFASVTDYGGNAGESEPRVIHIVSKEDILRSIHSELLLVRAQIDALARQQASGRKDLGEFLQESLLAGKIDTASSAKLSRQRQNQQRITRGIERASSEMARIVTRMELNRVGADKDRDWLTRIRGELDDLVADRSRPVEETIDRIRQEAQESPREPTLLSPLLDEQQRIENDLRGIALRLTEFGDYNAVIQQWREILRRQLEIRDRVIEKVQQEGRQQ